MKKQLSILFVFVLFTITLPAQLIINSGGGGGSADSSVFATKYYVDTSKTNIRNTILSNPVTLVAGTTVTNQANATVSFASFYTTYDVIDIYVEDIVPATDAQELQLLVSANGTTFDNAASNYKYANVILASAGTGFSNGVSNVASYISLGGSYGNASGKGNHALIRIWHPSATNGPLIQYYPGYISSAGNAIALVGTAQRVNSQVTQAIRLQFTNNISCSYTVIGYKL